MKIALYLGKFDIFNNKNLEYIEQCINNFKVDKVIIVPFMSDDFDSKYWKIINYLYYKFKYGTVIVSSIAKELGYPFNEYAILHAMKNKYYKDEIFILCDLTMLSEMSDWMNGEQIIKDYNFLIL